MKDIDPHLLFSFGLREVILFYTVSFILIFFIFKLKMVITNKNNTLLNIFFLIFCFFISTNYLIIWYHGENSPIGGYLIDYGVKNKKFITWGSMFFVVLITYLYSTDRFSKKR